jgi:hypothetical protein
MKNINTLFAAAAVVLGLASSGCSYVTSANPGLTVAGGDAWYTKDNYFIFYLGTDIYYCPKGGETCYLAKQR